MAAFYIYISSQTKTLAPFLGSMSRLTHMNTKENAKCLKLQLTTRNQNLITKKTLYENSVIIDKD